MQGKLEREGDLDLESVRFYLGRIFLPVFYGLAQKHKFGMMLIPLGMAWVISPFKRAIMGTPINMSENLPTSAHTTP